MTILLGPADADHYRVKVGRYGDRWYRDPLDTCPIAEATEAVWPSYSITKGASGKDWTFVGLKRVAAALELDPDCLRGLDYGRRYDALTSINKRGLQHAGQRGTNVHLRFESKLRGYPGLLIPDNAPGREYDAAVDQFFDAYQPELVAAEFVVIHRDLNGYGYGCTVDARLRIDGKVYAVDYKSRGEDSDHGAYPEEAAQIAAGARGQYMIVEGDHGPERRQMDDVDGGIIISVRPDGCRIYPVDIDKGWAHYQSMHAWWIARLAEREAVGKPWAPKKTQAVAATLTPAEQLAKLNPSPEEGGEADPAALTLLEQHYSSLPPGPRAWITALVVSATQHGVSFHARERKSLRRFEIIRGLVALALSGSDDDDTLRAVLASVVGDVAWFVNVEPGHLVGSLTVAEAAIFAARVDELNATTVPASVDADGRVVLHFKDLAATPAA